MSILSLLEVDVLRELERAEARSVTAPQIALTCKLELPRTISTLNTLRRLGLVHVHVSGIGTETRWRISKEGERELARGEQLTVVTQRDLDGMLRALDA